jgi:hypothetical protein
MKEILRAILLLNGLAWILSGCGVIPLTMVFTEESHWTLKIIIVLHFLGGVWLAYQLHVNSEKSWSGYKVYWCQESWTMAHLVAQWKVNEDKQ